MQCDGLISGSSSNSCFHLRPEPNSAVPPSSISTRINQSRFSSIRTRATINDGFVTSSTNFYELLGVEETVTTTEVKQAYKQLARKYHPDVSPPDLVDEYTQKFIRVQEAYETLSDPRRRADYDRDLARGLHLAFAAKKMYRYGEVMEDKSEWRIRWNSQLSGLKTRSMYKQRENMSWGARMRRQREEQPPSSSSSCDKCSN